MTREQSLEHELKCWPEFYSFLEAGLKPFEARINDRDYQVGDTLFIREFDPRLVIPSYTGRQCRRTITYILDNPAFLAPKVVILGLALPTRPPSELEAENERLRKAAHALYDCHYRNVNVTERGRTKPEEFGMAVQKLGEVLGLIGTAAQQEVKP